MLLRRRDGQVDTFGTRQEREEPDANACSEANKSLIRAHQVVHPVQQETRCTALVSAE